MVLGVLVGLTVGDGMRFGCGVILLLALIPFLTCGGCAACVGGSAVLGRTPEAHSR